MYMFFLAINSAGQNITFHDGAMNISFTEDHTDIFIQTNNDMTCNLFMRSQSSWSRGIKGPTTTAHWVTGLPGLFDLNHLIMI